MPQRGQRAFYGPAAQAVSQRVGGRIVAFRDHGCRQGVDGPGVSRPASSAGGRWAGIWTLLQGEYFLPGIALFQHGPRAGRA